MYNCPKCNSDSDLKVVYAEVTFNAPLTKFGFSFMESKSCSTENEVVECGACDYEASIDEFYEFCGEEVA